MKETIRNYKISLRVTPGEYDTIFELAQVVGLSMSNLLRSSAIIATTEHPTPVKFHNATMKAFAKCPYTNAHDISSTE